MYEGNTKSTLNKLSKNWGEKHTWSDNSRDLLVLSAITVKSKLVSARQQHAITQHNTITRTAVQQHMNPCKKKDSLNFNTIYLRGVISRYFWEIFVSKKELGVIYELSTRQQPVFFCSWANGSFFVLDIFIVRNPKFPPKNKTKEPNLGSLVDRGPNSTSPKSQELTLKSPIFCQPRMPHEISTRMPHISWIAPRFVQSPC